MKKRVNTNQRGFLHPTMIAIAVVTIGVVAFAGYEVLKSNNHKNLSSASTNSKAAEPASQATKNSQSPSAKNVVNAPASSPASNSTLPKVVTRSTTGTTSPTTTSTSSTSSSSSSSTATPQYYMYVGTIPAASLYNVKVPPPASQQPEMSLYACRVDLGNNTDQIKFYGTLASAVSNSNNWYVDLDLSSSASSDNIISSKAGTYSYQNNSWQNTSAGFESGIITSAAFNPGTISDFYLWANGSYGGSVWQSVQNHLNVTKIPSC